MSTPGHTPEEWRLAQFDERLLQELRVQVSAQAARPVPAAERQRPRGRRRLARRGILIPALAVVLVGGGAAALGGLIPGVSLKDPDGTLELRGPLADPAEPTSVVVESLPGTAHIGSTQVDCEPAEPVAVCGTAGVNDGVRATESTRVFLRVSDEITGLRADLAGVRAAREQGFMILSIPADVMNSERPSTIALTFLGASDQVIAQKTVPLPPTQ